jgi:hemerythrin-like domain-containing protein
MRDNIARQLQQDHRNISRVLSLMRMQLDFLQVNDGPGLTLLSNVMNYMRQFPGLMHHPLEELIFDRMPEADGALPEVVTRLRDEHRRFPLMETDFLICISRQLATKDDMRGPLRELGHTYLDSYAEHVQVEEREWLPLALDMLTAAQWDQVYNAGLLGEDPIFGPQSQARFDNLYDALMQAGAKFLH